MSQKGKRLSRALKYVIFVLLVVLAVVGMKMFFDSRTVETYTQPPRSVVVTRAQERDIASSATFSAYVMSETMVPVVPFVSGTIESYDIKAGDMVVKDQVLAVIDKDPYELQLAQAQAAASAYESSYDRLVRLSESGAATQQELDTVRSQRDAAQAQLELAQLQLSYTDVKAGVSGTVIMSEGVTGGLASTQSPLAVIADTGNLVAEVAVPEKYYDLFTQAGEGLAIEVSSQVGKAVTGASLVSIAPYIDPATKTFRLKVSLDDPSSFTIGSYVKVRITYSREEDTPAYRMRGKREHDKAHKAAQSYQKELMEMQNVISEERMHRFVGNTYKAIIEERIEGEDLYFGRIYAQAPDVDGLTVISARDLKPGDVVAVKIIKSMGFDLDAVAL